MCVWGQRHTLRVTSSSGLLKGADCLQVKAGKWAGGHDKRATQYFEVMGGECRQPNKGPWQQP